jgi:effector-binding domain-containing protein
MIRKTINLEKELWDFEIQTCNEIKKYLESINVLLGGGPIGCFHNFDFENLDIEIGYPVAALVLGKDRIIAHKVPSQKIISAIDFGPGKDHDFILEELLEWIQKNGFEMLGKVYFQYLNEHERHKNECLMKIMIPIK